MSKFYYNGILLPDIPTEHLANNPYAWIRKNQSSGYYDLVLGNDKWYYSSSGVYPSNSDVIYWYRIPLDGYESYNEWVFNKEATGFFGVDTNRTLLWSNDDILNGSLTSTDVYFAGSSAILESAKFISIEKIEAETGTLVGSAVVTDRTSLSGNIVVDGIGSKATGTLTLNFIAPKSDYYVIRMYFTHSGTRDFKYVLNGKTYLQSVVGTSYYLVETVDFQMYLNEGSNSVLFKGGTTTYAPMFDSFEILEISTNITKYLVRNNDTIYTVTDGELVEVSGTLNADLFIASGIDTIPDGALLMTLSAPEVLCWTNGDRLQTLTATVQGVPTGAHDITSDNINIGHSSIYGITSVEATASDGATFLLSFDGGAWMKYNDGTWSASDVGMTAAELMAIPSNAWSSVINAAQYMQLKATLEGVETGTQVVFNYDNESPTS